MLSAEQRIQRARLAALARWSRENPRANAERGQRGLLEKYRREVLADDPTVVEPELTRRAECKRRLQLVRMAYASAKVRAARKTAEITTDTQEACGSTARPDAA